MKVVLHGESKQKKLVLHFLSDMYYCPTILRAHLLIKKINFFHNYSSFMYFFENVPEKKIYI